MANQVTLTFAGDSKSLERTFDRVGAGAKGMAADMDKASGDVKRFGQGMENVNDTVDRSEGKFMGAADLLDGLGGAFGLPTDGAVGMARSFADLAGGFSSLLGPAITGILTKIGILTTATVTETTATTAATAAQTSLNLAFLANPIGITVAAVVALGAAFVVAWKNSETFRNIVRSLFDVMRDIGVGAFNAIKTAVESVMSVIGGIPNAFKTAWNAVAGFINNIDFTVDPVKILGRTVVPGFTLGLPDLPKFRMHMGGTVPGNPGQAVPILAMAGETVGRANGPSPQPAVVQAHLYLDGREIHQSLLRLQRTSGPLGFLPS